MNSLEILNILKSDAFTKTVFTDVLPSDRLPGRIQDLEDLSLTQIPQINQEHTSDIYHDRRKGRILGSICTKTWILQSELYSFFEQTLQHIHVEQNSFASRIIRRLWTICVILCTTSM